MSKPMNRPREGASKSMDREFINLPIRPLELPFSDGVLVDDTLFLSGRIGIDGKTGLVPPVLEEELKNLFDGFEAVLGKVGMTMDDLVYVQVFCPDLSLYDPFNEAYRCRFKKEFPARAFLGSGPLLRGGHFEMQGIAKRR